MAQPISAERGATIAVVGASARAAAFSLLRLGCHVVAADLFADADLSKHCSATRIDAYPEGFADWLRQTRCDGWLYTGALENYPDLVDKLAAIRPLLGNSGDPLRRVRDPLQLQEVLRQEDFPFPETRVAFADVPSEGRWLGKTYQGSGGAGVGPTDGAVYHQRFLAGTPLSAIFYGNRLARVTRQLVGESWTGAAEFQYCGSIGPWPVPASFEAQLVRLGRVLCEEFQLVGWYGVDLICADNSWWVIEVNPRYTASVEIVERSQEEAGAFWGKSILFAKKRLKIGAELSDSLIEQTGSFTWPHLADIPVAGTDIAPGQPVLTAFARAQTVEAVIAELQRRVAELEVQLYGEQPQGATACASAS
ncbi:MAG: ATP-grasp domain-containing protein [Pirellulales bacterium]|nr:ATP-grasp domain-containing protein [Pirellulales bacterium]